MMCKGKKKTLKHVDNFPVPSTSVGFDNVDIHQLKKIHKRGVNKYVIYTEISNTIDEKPNFKG